MKTLFALLIITCCIQTGLAMPTGLNRVVHPARKLLFKNNAFAAELLKITDLNTKPQWNSTSLLRNIPNFTSAIEEGYIPTITEMEEMIVELEKSALKDINADALRLAYNEAVQQGIGSALKNGTALEIGDNVPPDIVEAVRFHVEYLEIVMQDKGIKGIPEAVAEIISEADIQYLEAASAAAGDNNHTAIQTGGAMSELLGRYTKEGESTETNTKVENTEPDELTTNTDEQLPAAAMEFGLLLEEIRTKNSLSKKKFYTKLGIGVTAYKNYITFQRAPKLGTLLDKIMPGLESLGVDGREVQSAWERTNEAFTAVKTTNQPMPTETQITPTESAPAEKPETDGLTMKQVISQHRELLQQMEHNAVSEEMTQIVRDSLNNLEALQASQVEALAQLKDKMATENIGFEEITKYRATGLISRLIVKDIIDEISNDPLHADMYENLLAELAEDSEQAVILLEQYFNGERVLSEDELQQVCLHTTCTVGIRPMLAVERVLDEYQRAAVKIGDAEELSKEEREILATALAVYKDETQVTSKVEEKIEETPAPVQTVEKKVTDNAEQKADLEQAEARKRTTEESRKYHKNREVQAEAKREQENKESIYQPVINDLVDINSLVLQNVGKIDNTNKLIQAMQELGFIRDRRSGNHIMMKTQAGQSLSIGNQAQELKSGLVKSILKQAKSIRFMEELQAWEVAIEGDWRAKKQALLDYVDIRLAEIDGNSQENRNLKKLKKALNEMDSYLPKK